jgi:hypothetical protein
VLARDAPKAAVRQEAWILAVVSTVLKYCRCVVERQASSASAVEPPGGLARLRRAFALAADFPRPSSLGNGSKAATGAAMGLVGALGVLSVLGVWGIRIWWTTVTPYSPFGQWMTAFLVAVWSWYGLYSATGAWRLRTGPDHWVRRAWLPVFVGCAAFYSLGSGLVRSFPA